MFQRKAWLKILKNSLKQYTQLKKGNLNTSTTPGTHIRACACTRTCTPTHPHPHPHTHTHTEKEIRQNKKRTCIYFRSIKIYYSFKTWRLDFFQKNNPFKVFKIFTLRQKSEKCNKNKSTIRRPTIVPIAVT